MLPSEALLVTAAYGHLERALGGGDGMIVPFRRCKFFRGILFTNICKKKKSKIINKIVQSIVVIKQS